MIFQITSVDATYTAPTGGTNDRVYADACGWDTDHTCSDYLSCIGREQFGRKAGGEIVLTYDVKVLSAGSANVSGVAYAFSGSSFHYNSGYGAVALAIEATDPDPPTTTTTTTVPPTTTTTVLPTTTTTEPPPATTTTLASDVPGFDSLIESVTFGSICHSGTPYITFDFAESTTELSSLSLVFLDLDSVEVARIDSLTPKGETLYPGASADPKDWPGWMLLDNGTWVNDPSDAHLRSGVRAMIESVPEVSELVVYPESTDSCGSPEAISTPLLDGGLTARAELP